MGVVVLGMHRGGTSAVTRVLSLLGLTAGAPETLIGATAENPTGHWELEAVRALNDRILATVGARWSAPPPSGTDDQIRDLATGPIGDEARTLVAELLPARGWVWKDPRACLLLPFWRVVLGDEFVVVAITRPPLDIASSLAVRNGFGVGFGLALWERHLRSAVTSSRGLPVMVVAYDDLVDRLDDVWSDLVSFLVGAGIEIDVQRPIEEARSFVDGRFRHHRRTEGPLSAQQRALDVALAARAATRADWHGIDAGDETPGIQLVFDEHERLSRVADLVTQMEVGLAEKDEEIASVVRWLEENREETAHAWAEVRRLEADLHDALLGRRALAEALEDAIEERDGWRWTAERHQRGLSGRVRALFGVRQPRRQ